jgi:hypothetical protein
MDHLGRKTPASMVHMFSTGEAYIELGGDYYRRRDPERLTDAWSLSLSVSDVTPPTVSSKGPAGTAQLGVEADAGG